MKKGRVKKKGRSSAHVFLPSEHTAADRHAEASVVVRRGTGSGLAPEDAWSSSTSGLISARLATTDAGVAGRYMHKARFVLPGELVGLLNVAGEG